jgi:cytochrome c nitrite reductase small subunit
MRSFSATISVGILIGLLIGLGFYTFVYAKGYSYLTHDPAACANCHVMQDYYSAWMKGSHHAVATCNDCHTPHNFVGKYAIKATNGFFHSLAFTTGRFPDNIQIKGYNRRVTESTCKSCHAELTYAILGVHEGKDITCVKCHSNVGHSAAPFSFTSFSFASSPAADGTVTPSHEDSNAKSQQR